MSGQTKLHVELRREILSHYNKTVAPGFENSPTDVGFVYIPRRIHQFDESKGTLTVEALLFVNWWDTRLSWSDDPKYNKISYNFAMPNDIWLPTIKVINSGRAEQLSNTDIQIVIDDDGRIWWRIQAKLHPICTPEDLRWYPRDTQTCTLSLGTLYLKEIGAEFFGDFSRRECENGIVEQEEEEKNPHWNLLNLELRESYISAGNVMYYPTKNFIFTIRRQGWPLLATFIPLMVCFTFVSWSSFALPLHGKQLAKRLSVTTYSLFWSSFFLLVLVDTVPGVGRKSPIIIKVNVCVVIMNFLTSLHTIVVSRVHRNSKTHLKALQKLPGIVQNLLGLNKTGSRTPAGDGNGLLENMESPPDSGQKYLREESNLEDEADVVETAYDRAHLILQITVLTLTIVFLCLV